MRTYWYDCISRLYIGFVFRNPRTLLLLYNIWLVAIASSTETQCKNHELFPCLCEKIQKPDGFIDVLLNCSRKDFREIPDTLPRHLTKLDISHNELQPGMLHTLCVYFNLADVSVAYNDLNELPDHELNGCYIANSIDFQGNVFDSITADSLDGLEAVKSIAGLDAQSFDHDSFKHFRTLEHLSLNTHQTTIPEDLFDRLELHHLDLTVSGAVQLPGRLLYFGNFSLQRFHLESTSLRALPSELLQHLVGIEDIRIKLNNVDALPADMFQIQGEDLQQLEISGVHALPSGVFYRLDRLSHLVVHGLQDIPAKLLDGLMELAYLDLSHSCFESGNIPLDLFIDQFHLKDLNLSSCCLTGIDDTSFKGLESLERLNISLNKIRYLRGSPFYHMRNNVKEISLKANDISVVEESVFKQLFKLTTLDLSDNNIHVLQNDQFSDLFMLETLLLSRNKITLLPTRLFESTTALKTLNIAINVLDEDPARLMAAAKKLTVLNLSANFITELSVALVDNLMGLAELNIDYNPLHCDCKMIKIRNALLKRGVHIQAQCWTPKDKDLLQVVILGCQRSPNEAGDLLFASNTSFKGSVSSEKAPVLNSVTATATRRTALTTRSLSPPLPSFTTQRNFNEQSVSNSTKETGSDSLPVSFVELDTSDHLSPVSESSKESGSIHVSQVSDLPPKTSKTPQQPSITTKAASTKLTVSANLVSPIPYKHATTVSDSATTTRPKLQPVPPAAAAEKTAEPNYTEMSEKTKYYIAIGSVGFVSLVSIVVLVGLACKKRRGQTYEVSEAFSGEFEFEKFLDNSSEASTSRGTTPTPRGRVNALGSVTEIPTVQVDVVSDDGQVSSVSYPSSDVAVMQRR